MNGPCFAFDCVRRWSPTDDGAFITSLHLMTSTACYGVVREEPLNSSDPYSMRTAAIGEIAAARTAGMMAATNAHLASEPAAIVRAKGS
jgi:hypothetical protein